MQGAVGCRTFATLQRLLLRLRGLGTKASVGQPHVGMSTVRNRGCASSDSGFVSPAGLRLVSRVVPCRFCGELVASKFGVPVAVEGARLYGSRATPPPRARRLPPLNPNRRGAAPVGAITLIRCHTEAERVRPNPSLERTANGVAPWPRGAVVHVAPRGQGATPSSAAQLKR